MRHRNSNRRDFEERLQFLETMAQFLIESQYLFLGADALESAAAMLGQRLQCAKIDIGVGPGLITLERKKSDDFFIVLQRHVHQRGRWPHFIPKRTDARRKA